MCNILSEISQLAETVLTTVPTTYPYNCCAVFVQLGVSIPKTSLPVVPNFQ